MMMDKESWDEMTGLVAQVDQCLAAAEFDTAFKVLREFSTTCEMFMLEDMTRLGAELTAYLREQVGDGQNEETLEAFKYALTVLKEAMAANAESCAPQSIKANDVLMYLSVEGDSDRERCPSPSSEERVVPETPEGEEPPPSTVASRDFLSVLEEISVRTGGAFELSTGEEGFFQIRMPLACAPEFESHLTQGLFGRAAEAAEGWPHIDTFMESLLSFMKEFSQGHLVEAEQVLEGLTSVEGGAGLFKEVGGLARDLHESLRGFTEVLDPAMKNFVEERLPDSGHRLEHILEMTNAAATKTLNLAEAMQERNKLDVDHVRAVSDAMQEAAVILGSMGLIEDNGTGNPDAGGPAHVANTLAGLVGIAQRQIARSSTASEALIESFSKTREDIVEIIMTQDYQDLTGQIIQKIITLLEDLEKKLVTLIGKFGVKVEGEREMKATDELYGPSHKHRKDALHNQDEVDDLLKQYGF